MSELSSLLGRLGKLQSESGVAIARALLTFIATFPDTSHINIQLVRQLSPELDRRDLDKEILRTLQFLAGDELQILEPRFELIEPDQLPIQLTREDVNTVIDASVNPTTGEYAPNIKECVFLYFTPTNDGLRIAKLAGNSDIPDATQ